MARIVIDDVEKYGGGGNAFFQLKDDGEVAKCRVLYGTIDDVEAYTLHKVPLGNSERYVSCLRQSPDDPLSVCPLCAAKYRTEVKLFLPIYMEDEKVIKIWERGKKIIKQLQSMFNRYNPLYGTIMEIERQGKQGDNQTSYQFFPIETDNKSFEEFPEIPEILGTYVLDKTKEELEEYLNTKVMPGVEVSNKSGRNVESDGVRRRGTPPNTRRKEMF